MRGFDRAFRQGALVCIALAAVLLTSSVGAAGVDEVRALIAQNRLAEAARALKGLDEDIEVRLLRGVILSKQGRMDEATESFEALAKDHPELPQPLNNLAVLYAARGMTEQARETLIRAIELQPRHANAHRNLGDLYLHLAMDSYQRALSLGPGNRGLERKLGLLDQALSHDSVMPKSTPEPKQAAKPEPLQLAETGQREPEKVEAREEEVKDETKEDDEVEEDERAEAETDSSEAGEGETDAKPKSAARKSPDEDIPATPSQDDEEQEQSPVESAQIPLDSLAEASPHAGCFAAGPFLSKQGTDFAERWFADRGGSVQERQRKRMPGAVIYQVYLESAGTSEGAKALLAGLKAKRVRDAAIIYTGVLRYGVSLGAFKEKSRADSHLAWLKKRGVTDAKLRTQQPDQNTIWLLVNVADDVDFDADAFGSDFPGKKRIAADCE